MEIVLTEHARHKMHASGALARDVMVAVEKAVANPASMHRIHSQEDRYYVRVGDDLRAIVEIKDGRAILLTVMHHEP
jgi:hypothetical protein